MDLDPILDAAKPGDTIQLEAGIYYTGGCNGSDPLVGSYLKPGCKLLGRGQRKTLVKFHRTDMMDHEWHAIHGAGDGITVSGLTVDCGPVPDGWPRKILGIALQGDENTVNGCEVVRVYGIRSSLAESFGITFLGGSYGIVTNCYIHDFKGDYCTGIFTSGFGRASRNSVLFPAIGAASEPTSFRFGVVPEQSAW